MTTRAQRMRAAADYIAETAPGIPEYTKKMLAKARELRADADALEAVEQMLRKWPHAESVADRIRGEIKP